jgi:hypothetical protein
VSHIPVRTDLACRNCGTPAPLKFCPACGQETTLHPPTLGEFVHEFVGHYVALEGTLWRTLGLLICRPGRLTREYLDGRRRRYVLPLRLYLTASFLFFLVLKLVAAGLHSEMDVKADGHKPPVVEYRTRLAASASEPGSKSASSTAGPTSGQAQVGVCGGAGQQPCGRVEAVFNESLKHLQEHPQETMEHVRDHLLHWAPYAIFVLLPAFAGIMMLAYRNRRMTYGEHFVFSLHLHTFWFLAGLLLLVLPEAISAVAQLAVMGYGVWAMRETYGGRWGPTLLRSLLVVLLYGIVLTVGLAVLGLAVVAAG